MTMYRVRCGNMFAGITQQIQAPTVAFAARKFLQDAFAESGTYTVEVSSTGLRTQFITLSHTNRLRP